MRLSLNYNALPEKTLLAAVLIRAVMDVFVQLGDRPKNARRDAIRFFELEKNNPKFAVRCDEGFSFGYCCMHLDLCPATIHKNLKQFLDEQEEFGRVYKYIHVNMGDWYDTENPGGGIVEYSLPRLGQIKAKN